MTSDLEQLYQQVLHCLNEGDAESLRSALAEAWPADIAEIMDLLDDEERSRLIYVLPPRTVAEVIVLLDEAVRGEVVEDLDDQMLSDIVAELSPHDAADVIAELPADQGDEVLDSMPQAQSDEIQELLNYGESSAGGIMDPRAIALFATETVGQAVEEVRRFASHEDLHFVYVIDNERRPVGTIPLRRLVVHETDTVLADIMDPDPVTVSVDEDQETVLHIIRKYDLPAMPVIDADGRFVGRVTYDDLMDVAAEEAAEDIYRMAGTDAAELETHSPFRAARVRMMWLIPCMVGTSLAGGIIALFRETGLSLSQHGALLIFVPMIAATSGNAGIQVAVIVLRGFATGELVATKLKRVLLREAPIAILVAILCAVTGALFSVIAFWLFKAQGAAMAAADDVYPVLMGVAVGLGMLCAITVAFAMGVLFPFLFRRIGVDPAIASGPLITSLNDLISVAVYLAIALLIMTR